MHQSRALGVDISMRRTVVTTFLDDMVMELIGARTLPRRLTPYVTVAFRHYVARDDKRGQKRGEEVELEQADKGAIQVTNSGNPSDALRLVCDLAVSGLSAAETELTAYLIERVPARQVAEWLGIEHSAAKVRLHRLRAKLRAIVSIELGKLSAGQRAEVSRVLARAGYPAGKGAPAEINGQERGAA